MISIMKPIIAIPIGDPAGIGPEIVSKAIADASTINIARCVVIGDKKVIENAIKITNTNLKVHTINDVNDGIYEKGYINIIDLANIEFSELEIGKVSGMCGRAAYEYIVKSIELAKNHKVNAISTAPINKESLKAGNINFIGHTEIFASLTKTEDPLTLFEVHNLRVFFLSRHVSLKKACELVKKDRIKDYVKRCLKVLNQLGITEGTMAIAGLNPHSGEHGLFGDEEVLEVIPAVQELKDEGYNVSGPIGADSVFHLALKGYYNSVLSLYHDQGHIATKTLDFERTISITGGMPILRTSVDHGTAFDIAGTGKASAVSMIEAIRLAVKYYPGFVE
jgi:4-hydroxythreonine-4-phosphate dehydrogenase